MTISKTVLLLRMKGWLGKSAALGVFCVMLVLGVAQTAQAGATTNQGTTLNG